MRSYCRINNQYILVGRLLDDTTLQIIQDTKITLFKIPSTDLKGDVVCVYKQKNKEISDLCLYPINETTQFLSLDNITLLITNKKSLQNVKTDGTGVIILNFKDFKLEVPQYISDFYHVFLITDTKLNPNSNLNIYTGNQII